MTRRTQVNSRRIGRWFFFLVAATALVAWSGSPAVAQSSTNLYAVVDQFGTLVSGNGVVTVNHSVIGQYEVTFTTNVSNCAYIATTANLFTQALQVFTAGGHMSTQGVYVETKNQGGGLTDGPFHLFVACNTPGISYAVVGYKGELVRSSPGATVVPQAFAGQYEVNFPASVAACAYVATVGDPGNALVFAPSGVYTGSRASPMTVYVETKNPGGGLQSGIPFHLAVVCPEAPGTRMAVVRDDGLPQRTSPLTSSFNFEQGHYQVVTGRDISDCATVATRGSVDTAVPFTPATVEIIPGFSVNSIGFEVRNLLFFGGDLINQAFHTAIVCGTTL